VATLKEFLETVFQPGEVTCFSSTATGTKVSNGPAAEDVYFCVNALHPYKDLNPTQPWHSELKPRRADHNVVSLRSFLLEIDEGPLEAQEKILRSLPISTLTYSGGKSLHGLIVLQEPLQALTAYKHLASRLLLALPQADKACRNPSRLSRLPGRIRPDTGKMQELLYLNGRVEFSALDSLLPALSVPQYKQRTSKEVKAYISPLLAWASQKPDEVMREKGIASRNALFFFIGKRCDDGNVSLSDRVFYVESAYRNLSDTSDFSITEAYMAARVRG
jgi:hypothetical protein